MSLLDEWRPSEIEREHIPVQAKFISDHKYNARRYIFDDSAIVSIGNLIRDYPNVLLDNYQFALPPYETVYMEFNLNLFIRTMNALSTTVLNAALGRSPGSEDMNVGYLIHKNHVSLVVKGKRDRAYGYELPEIIVSPIAFTMDGSVSPGFKPIVHSSQDDAMVLAWCLGSTLTNKNSNITNELEDDFLHRFRPLSTGLYAQKSEIQRQFTEKLLYDCAGEVRNVLMLLLWLNQPKLVDFETVPACRRWVGKKQIAYAKHNIVRLKSHTTKQILRVFHERNPVRRHEVAAHWRNFDIVPSCSHMWPLFPNDKHQWVCSSCGQKRIRVRDHMRGDASRGFVTKEYKVS